MPLGADPGVFFLLKVMPFWYHFVMNKHMVAIMILSLMLAPGIGTAKSSSHTNTADKNDEIKKIYELRKKCSKRAVEFAHRVQLCDGKGEYKFHYNKLLDVCFIDISARCNEGHGGKTYWSESMIDINENENHAVYVGDGTTYDDYVTTCFVGEQDCDSLSEFQELIKAYMKN